MEQPQDLPHCGNSAQSASALPLVSDRASSHREAALRHLGRLAKPPGSLGRLEDLAGRLCAIQGTLAPQTRPRRVVVFAADHGVVAEGVTAWPSSVTAVMIRAIVRGGSACAALAAACDAELVLVDVGSQSEPLSPGPGYEVRKIGPGTGNLAREPAMSPSAFEEAVAIGVEYARRARDDGMKVVAAGEMGIGNTTPASCLAMLLARVPLELAVGRGAGADDSTLERKRRVVEQATARVRRKLSDDPRGAIAEVAGFEIAAMSGFFVEASRLGLTIVVDGMIATSAALIAETLAPGTAEAMIAAHLSAEPAHAPMLAQLGLEPLLSDWQLRLGEGTGALLAIPLLDAAAAMVSRMDTLDALGIVPTETADGPS
jgi:nicotinate-nucleotide--dimethylbenzimidazole phosphoribosyltransferase